MKPRAKPYSPPSSEFFFTISVMQRPVNKNTHLSLPQQTWFLVSHYPLLGRGLQSHSQRPRYPWEGTVLLFRWTKVSLTLLGLQQLQTKLVTVISSRNNKSVNSATTIVYAQSIAIPLMSPICCGCLERYASLTTTYFPLETFNWTWMAP